jgi:hypothetical protein
MRVLLPAAGAGETTVGAAADELGVVTTTGWEAAGAPGGGADTRCESDSSWHPASRQMPPDTRAIPPSCRNARSGFFCRSDILGFMALPYRLRKKSFPGKYRGRLPKISCQASNPWTVFEHRQFHGGAFRVISQPPGPQPIVFTRPMQARSQEIEKKSPVSAARTNFTWRRRLLAAVMVAALLLVIARLSAGWIIESSINRRLTRIPGYTGHVGRIYLHLWRGAYSIHDIEIKKKTGKIAEPYFSAPYIDFSVDWRELINGKVVSKIYLENARINLVHGAQAATSQTEIDRRWQDVVHDIFPIDITNLEIRDGVLHYADTTSKPAVDIWIRHMNLVATGLQNRPSETAEEFPAKINVEGTSLGSGKLKMFVKIEPLAAQPHFYLSLALQDVAMPALNQILLAYSNVEVTAGTFRAFVEVAARGGRFEGYIKPFFEHLKFTSKTSEEKSGLGHTLWTNLMAALDNLFKNKPRDQLGMRIPVQGEFGQAKASIWATIMTMLRHGFIKALPQGIEGSVKPGEVTPSSGESDNTTNQVKNNPEK